MMSGSAERHRERANNLIDTMCRLGILPKKYWEKDWYRDNIMAFAEEMKDMETRILLKELIEAVKAI